MPGLLHKVLILPQTRHGASAFFVLVGDHTDIDEHASGPDESRLLSFQARASHTPAADGISLFAAPATSSPAEHSRQTDSLPVNGPRFSVLRSP